MQDLTPSHAELELAKRFNPELDETEILEDIRAEKLSGLILDAVLARFTSGHDVEPTEEEVRELADFVESMSDEHDPDDSLSRRATLEFYRACVRQWKISRLLFDKYGGIVIFQQGNPLEPVGAMAMLLKSHEARKDFTIYDQRLRARFWHYFTMDHGPFVVPPEEVDFSRPWWTKLKKKRAKA